jgi:ribonuclease D
MPAAATWIDRPDALAAAAARWLTAADDVALDTEFVFERTYRPRLGIVQIAVAGEIALIDAVRIPDLSALGPLLADPARRKLLHSGSGDLPILRRAGGVALRGLLDTQIAAAFAGLGPSLSYAALVKTLLGVELAKHETRTDWLRRPLSPDQLRYAAEDVEYLPAVAADLEERLRVLGRLEWALEDSATLATLDGDTPDPEVAWRRVKGMDRLPASVRAVARSLAAWREREADRLDLARPFLLRDETLLALAKRDALAPADAAALPGYDARRHAHQASRWAAALQAAHADVAAGTAPAEDPRTPADVRDRQQALEVRIAALVTQRATELGLPGEQLLSRRQRERAVEAWLRTGGSLAAAVGGFRGAVLGVELDTLAADG